MAAYTEILTAIHHSGADYAWIGLGAAAVYGSKLVSYDFDFFVRPDPVHLDRARTALRGVGLTEVLGEVAATNLLVMRTTVTFTDPYGGPAVDLLTEISGPSFDEVWRDASVKEVHGQAVRVASLRHIIESKRAADREKDRYALKRIAEDLGLELKETAARYRAPRRKR
jgi:hypothetical protein